MAVLTKSRKRTPIAESQMMLSRSRDYVKDTLAYTITVDNDEEETPAGKGTYFKLSMSPKEGLRVALWIVDAEMMETETDSLLYKRKKSSQALRDLADRLEKEGN